MERRSSESAIVVLVCARGALLKSHAEPCEPKASRTQRVRRERRTASTEPCEPKASRTQRVRRERRTASTEPCEPKANRTQRVRRERRTASTEPYHVIEGDSSG